MYATKTHKISVTITIFVRFQVGSKLEHLFLRPYYGAY